MIFDLWISLLVFLFIYYSFFRLADIMRTIFGIAFWIIAVIIVLLLAEISFDSAILPLSSFVRKLIIYFKIFYKLFNLTNFFSWF